MKKNTITGNKSVHGEYYVNTTTTTHTGTEASQRGTQATFLPESRELVKRQAEGTRAKREKGKKRETPEVSVKTAKEIASYAKAVPGLSGKSGSLLGKVAVWSAPKVSGEKRPKPEARAIEYPSYFQNELLKQGNRALEEARSQEARNCYERALRQAEQGDIALQFFCIKGIGDCLLVDQAYRDAAWYYNYALALCEVASGRWRSSERGRLLKALREVERSYIREVVGYEGTIREDSLDIEKRRKRLAQVRMVAKQKLDGGMPAEEIQRGLTEGLKALSCELIKDCFAVLPEAPCEHAIMGLGSMSRNEMCFYSDLEFAVLLDEKKKEDWAFFAECKNYFVRFTKLLELKIINVGESLNEEEIRKNLPEGIFNLVVSGFALDGDGSPLDEGSALMDTPERMAKIQGGEKADIIHVSLLEAVCYLYGNRELVDRYEKAVAEIFNEERMDPFGAPGSSRLFREVEALTLLERGSGFLEPTEMVLRRFAPKLGEKLMGTDSTLPFLNIKQDLYRFPSETVSKLCMYYGVKINERSTLERLKALREKGIISEDCYEKLCTIMKKIIRLRLRAHEHYKREDERAYRCEDPRVAQNPAYFKLESTRSIVDIYQVLIPLYEALKSFCEKNGGERIEVASFDKMRAVAEGFVYEKLRDYGEAEKHYREVLFISKENVEARIGLGQVLYAQGKYEEARDCYKETYVFLRRSVHKRENHPDLIKVLKGRGVVYRALNDNRLAVKYYKMALKIHNEVYTEGYYFSRAEILRKLGGALNEVGERNEAVQVYREALKIYEKASVVDDTMVNLKKIEVLNGIIVLTEDLKELVGLYEKVVLLKKACYGEGHLSVAKSLKELGDVCGALSGSSERMRTVGCYGEILDIYESFGSSKEELDIVLDALGKVCGDLGITEDVRELYRQTFGMVEASEEKRAESFSKLGDMWRGFGEKERAVKKYEQALGVFEGYYGKKKVYGIKPVSVSLTLGSILYNVGKAYRDLGRIKEAVKLIEQAVHIYEVSYGKEDFEIAKVLAGWGEALEKLKKGQKVKQLKKKVLRICRVLSGNESVQEAVWMLLKNDPEEKKLHLPNQGIGNVEAKILAKALETNQMLQQLHLKDNQIGAEGVKVLAEVLEKNRTLQQLDLENNQIGDEEAKVLAEVLKRNRTLQQLNLKSNQIGIDGAEALVLVLEMNQTLRELNLKGNPIGFVGTRAWIKAIEANQTGRVISEISENKILREAVEVLLQNNSVQTKLDLSTKAIDDAGIKVLVAALAKNQTLQQLYLSRNFIGAEGAKAIAQAIEKNPKISLQQLHLEYNQIGAEGAKAIAQAIKTTPQITLQQLDLGDNQIGYKGAKAIAQMIEKMPQVSLQHLHLNRNDIGAKGAKAIAQAIERTPQIFLQQLDLGRNKIGSEGAKAIAQAIEKAPQITLQQLDLRDNQIGYKGAKAIAQAIEKTPQITLQQLYLGENQIGTEGAKAIAQAIEKAPQITLQQLDLGDNQIGAEGAKAIAQAIEKNPKISLQQLDLGGNQIGAEGVKAITQAIEKNPKISFRQLDFGRNQISTEGAKAIAQAIKKNPKISLQQLNLEYNQVGAEGAKAIAQAIENTPQIPLQRLHLGWNQIGAEGAKAIAQAIEKIPQIPLQRLHLDGNHIGTEGAKAIAQAIENTPQIPLQQLNLSRNQIGDEGAKVIAQAIENTPQIPLQRLQLSWNEIGDEGAKAIAQTIENTHQIPLQQLQLSRNEIGDEGAQAIAQAIEKNPQILLQRLHLSGNKIGDKGRAALQRAQGLQQNSWVKLTRFPF